MRAVTDYPQRQALLLAADGAKLKTQEVEELLWLIQACPTLERLPLALAGLNNALFAADRVWPGLLARLGLDFLRPLSRSLISLLADTQLPATPPNAPRFQDWLRDGENVNRNPLYAALCELPVKLSPYAYRCWLTAAHVFLAQVALLRSAGRPFHVANTKTPGKQYFPTKANYEAYDFARPWDQIRVPARHAALALRDFCGNPRWQRGLLRSLSLYLPPKRLARSGSLTLVAPHLSNSNRTWLQDRLNYITRYLEQVYNLKSRHKGHGRTRKQQPPTGPGTASAAGVRAVRGVKKGPARGAAGRPENDLEDWDRFDICPDEDDEEYDDDDDSDEDDDHDSDGQSDDEDEFEYLDGGSDSGSNSNDDGTAVGKCDGEEGGTPDRTSDGEAGSGDGDKKSEGSSGGRNRAGGGGSDGYQAIRASKGFAFAMDRLAPCELAPVDVEGRAQAHQLLDSLLNRHAANGRNLSSTPEFRRAETLVFLLTGLWTGSSAERTCLMLASTDPNCDGDAALICVLDTPLEGARFKVRVVFPTGCAQLQTRIGKDRFRTDQVDLPDAAELGPLLWKLSELKGKVNSTTSTDQQAQPYRVFDRPLIEYTREAKELLQPWNRTARLTLSSIRSTLYGAILSWSGKDIVATTMITGVYKGPARVPMFYSSRRMEGLQNIYTGTVSACRHRIRLESEYAASHRAGGAWRNLDACLEGLRRLEPADTFVPALNNAPHVGSRRCPEDYQMQGAVAGLIGDLEEPWDLTSDDQLINYTNLYTFFTIWFFGFVTGCRALATPYVGLTEVSPINLMAALHDKGEEKTRPVWIMDSLYLHMQYYSKYVEQLNLFYSKDKPCWFVAAGRAPGEFTKHLIEAFVQRYLPGFPANISRRYMMNALWDSGCPPELVRAWAGHATAGNAFWASGATAHYGEIASELRRYIEPILNYLGFVPMAGKELNRAN